MFFLLDADYLSSSDGLCSGVFRISLSHSNIITIRNLNGYEDLVVRWFVLGK